eukprot:1566413-Pleurochrysis_carterae.AAC.1
MNSTTYTSPLTAFARTRLLGRIRSHICLHAFANMHLPTRMCSHALARMQWLERVLLHASASPYAPAHLFTK